MLKAVGFFLSFFCMDIKGRGLPSSYKSVGFKLVCGSIFCELFLIYNHMKSIMLRMSVVPLECKLQTKGTQSYNRPNVPLSRNKEQLIISYMLVGLCNQSE